MTVQTQIAQKTLGADVRTLRKTRGLTLSQMAEMMGKSVARALNAFSKLAGVID